MTAWSSLAWRETSEIIDKITAHPFLTGLINGSLPKEKFNHFARQNCLYLFGMCRALGALSSRCADVDHAESFLTLAVDTASIKQALHSSFTPEERAGLSAAPACLSFVSYLHAMAFTAPLETAVAVLASCFWVKEKICDHIRDLDIRADNPYSEWVSLFNLDGYHQAVARAVGIADEMAETSSETARNEMTHAFRRSTQLHWMFFDSSWRMEQWPV
ncbi:TenA family protein [Deltaproteobacteria bacterium OttesenSCG-928-K17]|nr:TenA family protein [Deltaproteobacteria bacterium OttesenSCG-928-K17]